MKRLIFERVLGNFRQSYFLVQTSFFKKRLRLGRIGDKFREKAPVKKELTLGKKENIFSKKLTFDASLMIRCGFKKW